MGINCFDQYSLLHFATGVIAYFWGIKFINWVLLHAAFEIIENTDTGMFLINRYAANVWPGGKPYRDSFTNSMCDNIFAFVGWITAYLLDEYGNKYGLYPKHIT
jgi:hypothetical protein